MKYFIVRRTEWRLVQAEDQPASVKAYESGKPMSSQTETMYRLIHTSESSLANVCEIEAETELEAWKKADGILHGR